jgi:hypothetical protein
MKAFAAILFAVFAFSSHAVRAGLVAWQKSQPVLDDTPLYLPEAKYVKLATFGFDEFFSDIFWFYTLNYFGKEFRAKGDFKWLDLSCSLVSNLDPKAQHVYEFCGTTLAWAAKDANASNGIYSMAMKEFPDYWRFPYLRGFNYWYFLERNDLAEKDLRLAAVLPGAPRGLASIASRLMIAANDADTAVAFLSEQLSSTKDESMRGILQGRLNQALLSRDLIRIRGALNKYKSQYGQSAEALDKLVEAGLLKEIPPDPFGGRYLYNRDTGEVSSSSGKSELDFRGKTATTGSAKHEFLNQAAK